MSTPSPAKPGRAGGALRPAPRPATPAWIRGPLRKVWDELAERVQHLPTTLNEYGYDPFGADPRVTAECLLPALFFYRYWFRVETSGIERVPRGRVLLIANHAGNTFAFDGAMLATSLFVDCEPPRIARGMVEYYLPTIPFFNVFMVRFGSIVGRPENCIRLLEREEAVMVFPEGERGFIKPYSKAYELQRFGLGFLRLALRTRTPIVPIGIVGSEEAAPGIARLEKLGQLVGAPALPLTPQFPLLGLAGALPLPVKFRISFGQPLHFLGDPDDEDATIEKHVEVVKEAIRALVVEGRAARPHWFA